MYNILSADYEGSCHQLTKNVFKFVHCGINTFSFWNCADNNKKDLNRSKGLPTTELHIVTLIYEKYVTKRLMSNVLVTAVTTTMATTEEPVVQPPPPGIDDDDDFSDDDDDLEVLVTIKHCIISTAQLAHTFSSAAVHAGVCGGSGEDHRLIETQFPQQNGREAGESVAW